MKVIKTIFVVLLSIILSGILIGMMITFPLHYIVSGDIVHGLVQEQFVEEFHDSFSIDEEKLKDAIQNEEVREFIDKYVDITMDAISSENDLSQLQIGDDLKELLTRHQDVLMDEFNIDSEKFEEILNSDEFDNLNQEYQNTVVQFQKQLDPQTKNLLSLYHFLQTDTYHLIVIGSIILVILLIALFQWSLIRWMIPVGICSIVAGVLGSGIAYLIQFILQAALSEMDSTIDISMKPMFIYTISILIVGIILIIIYNILKKRNQYSKVSTVKE